MCAEFSLYIRSNRKRPTRQASSRFRLVADTMRTSVEIGRGLTKPYDGLFFKHSEVV